MSLYLDNATPLYFACSQGHVADVSALLAAGAAKDLAMPDGTTPLYTACSHGHVAVVSVLLAAGAAKDLARADGMNPLFVACFRNHVEVVSALLAAGAAKGLATPEGFTPLYIACLRGHVAVVSALLVAGATKDLLISNGTTPLLGACLRDHVDVVSALLAAGASKDLAKPDGTTPLFAACLDGHFAIVSALLAAGAEKDLAMPSGATPLYAACMNGHLACVKLLSSYGAARSKLGYFNVQTAAEEEGQDKVSAWLTLSREWSSPLHHLEIISADRARDLLRAGADLNAAGQQGGPTPLSLARALGEAGSAAAASQTPSELVLRAAELWSPEGHNLFPAAARARAVEMLRLGVLLSWLPRFRGVEGALLDAWRAGVIPRAVDRVMSWH